MISLKRSVRLAVSSAIAAFFLSGVGAISAHAESHAEAGWHALKNNQNTVARTEFKAALAQNPKDVAALRGLGWLNLQEENPVGALQAWRPLYHLAPEQWQSVALWPEMVKLFHETGRRDLLEGAARDILAAHKPGSLQASAQTMLALLAQNTGKESEAAQHWSALAYLRRWKVIGPFDNISKSGFDKAFGPEREIDFSKSYVGNNEIRLSWNPLRTVYHDGTCDPATSLSDGQSDVFYATTAVFFPKDRDVVVQWESLGASKLFLNGRLLFADPLYRPGRADLVDPFPVAATLHAGWNTLMVKICDDEHTNSSFGMRLTTPEGQELTGLQVDPAHAVTQTLTDAVPTPIDTESVALLRKQAATDSEAAASLVEELREQGDDAGSITVARAALEREPDWAWLHWQLSQTLSDDGQIDAAHAERDLALAANPRILDVQTDALSQQKDSLSSNELVARLKTILRFNLQNSVALSMLSSAYDALKLTTDALRTARLAEKATPGTSSILQLVSVLDDHDRKAEAEALLAAAVKETPGDVYLLAELADMDQEEGKTAAGIAVYRRMMAVESADPSTLIKLATLYRSDQDSKDAISLLRTARLLKPQDSSVCEQLADALIDLGQKKEPLALLAEAISLDPSQVSLREKRQLLAGEKPVIDLAPATPSDPILKKAKTLPAGSESAVVLLDEGREVVYPDFATLIRYHRIVKVFDDAAVKRYTDFPVGGLTSTASVTVEAAHLIKAKGQVEDVTDDARSTYIPFPSLGPGDVIDVTYRVEDYAQGGLAHHFWNEWQFDEPEALVLQSHYVLIAPPGLKYQTQEHGTTLEPTVRDVPGWRIREWRMANIPAYKGEIAGVPQSDAGAWLDFSSIGSWSDIVGWYRDLSGPRCIPDSAIRAKALELTKDAKTDDEKLRAVIAFVRSLQYQSTPFRMSAYVPTEGKKVLQDEYGDCKDKAALITSLLSAVGIKSEMVLLSGRDHGLTPYLPSPRFNHAIARVQTEHGPLWVDATANEMSFADLPYADQQVPALVISDTTTDLVTTPVLPAEQNHMEDFHTAMLGTDGILKGNVVVNAVGNWAWILRSAFTSIPENRTDDLLRSLAGSVVKGSQYDSGNLQNLEDLDKPLVIHIDYHTPDYGTSAGDFLLLALPWGDSSEDSRLLPMLSKPSRQQDIETAETRGLYSSTLRLELPAGLVPQDLKPDAQIDSPYGSAHVTYQFENNVLTGTKEVTLKSLRVPLKEIPAYVAFLKSVADLSGKQMVFKKS